MVISLIFTFLYGHYQARSWMKSSLHPATIQRRLRAVRIWFAVVLFVAVVLCGLVLL